MSGDESELDTFAKRLNALAHTQKRDDGEPWTNDRIAERLGEVGGPTLSTPYVQQLRTGRRGNPSWLLVVALAQVFRVPVSYFDTTGDPLSTEDLQLLNAVRSTDLRDLIVKLEGIGPQARQVISRLVDEVGSLDQTKRS
ncbi:MULTISPECIES: hypothetical protein [unclassified Pseudonocardia]|uniref:hypothetical protein n=1 Tax=unclassified Pseudonocardia TaxID=2619320 RepID=UPI00094AED65|nr:MULTISPECIES: hypothetical protein [unclassified Pseudonocardia]